MDSNLTETEQGHVLDIRTIMLAHCLQALRQIIHRCHVRATQSKYEPPEHDQILLLQHAAQQAGIGRAWRSRSLRGTSGR